MNIAPRLDVDLSKHNHHTVHESPKTTNDLEIEVLRSNGFCIKIRNNVYCNERLPEVGTREAVETVKGRFFGSHKVKKTIPIFGPCPTCARFDEFEIMEKQLRLEKLRAELSLNGI
jgi:hypothetical protein